MTTLFTAEDFASAGLSTVFACLTDLDWDWWAKFDPTVGLLRVEMECTKHSQIVDGQFAPFVRAAQRSGRVWLLLVAFHCGCGQHDAAEGRFECRFETYHR